MLARLRSSARMIFRRSRWEDELREELQFHIDERTHHLVAKGLAPEEAARRARMEFGGVEGFKEACREARGGRWIDEFSRNLIAALRSMRRHPGFTAIAVVSLALGIGANLAVFGLLHRLVLTTLPVRDPHQLVQLVVHSVNGVRYRNPFPKFVVMRDNLDVFHPLFGWGGRQRSVTVGERSELVQVTGVTGNYFDALGVQPAVGRLLTERDEREHATRIAVISHQYWRSAFAGSHDVVGRTLAVDGETFEVVGVVSPGFTGTEPGAPPAVYLPPSAYERVQDNALKGPGLLWFHIMGRLPDGVSRTEVAAIVRERWAELDEPNRRSFSRNTRDRLEIEDGSRGYSGARIEFSGAVRVLMGLVAAVFLISCANLATLLFVRGASRLREMSIRIAVGATRGQLMRQWMTECLLIASLGGIAGLLAARWITDTLLLFVPEADRGWLTFETGSRDVLLTIAFTAAATAMCGLVPALRSTRVRADVALGSRAATVAAPQGPLAQLVLAGQLAVSLVLVVGGVLFARTLWNLNNDSGGFDRKAVVYAVPDLAFNAVPRDRQLAIVQGAIARLAQSPLVAAVSMGSAPMVWGDGGFGYVTGVTGYTLQPNEDNTAFSNSALPGYFRVLGIPLVAGRDFQERDRPPAREPAKVAIVNESLARHYFAGRNPIGERITTNAPLEIVGVVADSQSSTLRDPRKDRVYYPISAEGWGVVVARATSGVSTDAVVAEVRTAFAALPPSVKLDVAPLEDAVQRSIGRDRMVAQLSAALGLLGMLLASIGLYASMAHSVSSRTREIGVRLAVGATSGRVLWMVLRQSLAVTGVGLLIGLPAAVGGGQLIHSMLFGVAPSDPATLTVSALVLAGAGLVAAWAPARRAARLDPADTLRCE